MMRRWHWSSFFDYKQAYFSTGNVTALLARYGPPMLKTRYPLPVTRTAQYVERHRRSHRAASWGLRPASRMRDAAARSAAAGARRQPRRRVRPGRCNGGRREAVDRVPGVQRGALLQPGARRADRESSTTRIDKEIIIVESNSTDGTREIVRRYEHTPGVTVIYEDRPQGKGHAVPHRPGRGEPARSC